MRTFEAAVIGWKCETYQGMVMEEKYEKYCSHGCFWG